MTLTYTYVLLLFLHTYYLPLPTHISLLAFIEKYS